MTYKYLQDPTVVKEITLSFQHGTMTVEDLASHYSVSVTTIRRVLADAGLVVNRAYKTKSERAMLEFLESFAITDLDRLKARIQTRDTVKAYFNNLPIEQRVQWLNESINKQGGNAHAANATIQQSKLTQ